MKGSIERRGPNSFRLVVSTGVDGGGKQIKLTRLFKTDAGLTESAKLKAADGALAEFKVGIKKGNTAQSKGMTVAGLWSYWLEHYAHKNLEETTVAYYENMWPRIKQALGGIRLDRVEPKHIQAFLKNLAEPGVKVVQKKKAADPVEGQTDAPAPESTSEPEQIEPVPEQKEAPLAKLSPTTIRKYHAVLSGMFARAVKWRLMDYNPCEHTEPPRAQQKTKEIYDLETTGRFLEALEGEETRHKLMVLLALTAGLRREEIFGLRWEDIEENIISIRKARVVVGNRVITKDPKTGSSVRSVSVPGEVVALIKKHGAEEAAKQLKKGTEWKGSKLVFTDWYGADLHPQSMNNFLRRFCDANNLPRIQPHAFRHMAGTFLIVSGTDYRTVSGKLGHSRASITMNTYAHLLKSAEQETANTMTDILATARQQAAEKKKARTK